MSKNMPYAIELFFDADSEARLFSLWDIFAGLGAPPMRSGDQRPHISLAVADALNVPATRQLLDHFSRACKRFSVSLAALDFFLSTERVAFLAPKAAPELPALHERFFAEFTPLAHGPSLLYAPALWIPHCTLAVGLQLEQVDPAFEAVHSFGLPLDCAVVEIGLVEFFPVKQVHGVPLA